MPRPNGYQSLHTSVISEKGTPFEVQIRTDEMHQQAEEGIAAHWKYKEGRVGDQRDERYFQWMRQLLEWQQEVRDPQEFINNLKIDLYPEEVYIFTPRGEVKALPRGATPLDFAYAIHTDVGHRCVGARVNGKMVPLRTRLKNGDIVEIVTQAGHTPSRDWLNFVVTSRARSKISHFVQRGRTSAQHRPRAQAVREGRAPFRPQPEDVAGVDGIREAGRRIRQRQSRRADRGDWLRQVVAENRPARAGARTASSSRKSPPTTASFPSSSASCVRAKTEIKVNGADDLMVFRARCCNPIRGEKIVGYITRGKGVSVHSANCPNVINLIYDPERRIDVEWDKGGEAAAATPCG